MRAAPAVMVIAAAAMLALGVSAAFAQPADPAGATVSGCSGSAISSDSSGKEIGTISVPGAPPSSRDKPLKVARGGSVAWQGSTASLIKNLNWNISLFGIPVQSGSADNDDEKTSDSDVEKVDDYLPVKVTGKFYVSFEVEGEGPTCKGNLWIELTGNPIATIPWFAGVGLVLVGLVGLWFARPSEGGAA